MNSDLTRFVLCLYLFGYCSLLLLTEIYNMGYQETAIKLHNPSFAAFPVPYCSNVANLKILLLQWPMQPNMFSLVTYFSCF